MKKSIRLMTIVSVIISVLMVFTMVTSAAVTTPTDFKTLDNFDGYSNSAALTTAGYAKYAYGANASRTVELTTTGAQSGKALKLTNGGAQADLDLQKEFDFVAGATGISFWINNEAGAEISIAPLVSYNLQDLTKPYLVKAEGTSSYVETTPTGSAFYPIKIEAGFKGEIAIPFSSYMTTYPMGNEKPETRVFVMQVWGVESAYSVILDNFKFFGVDVPDAEVTDAVSESDSDSDSVVSETESPTTSDSSNAAMISLLFLVVSGAVLVISRKMKVTA